MTSDAGVVHLDAAEEARGTQAWPPALLHALPLLATMLGLFYYWFALADRYRVFLYFHDMGPLVPDTSPFSVVTRSRYWMSGLVAAGLVMVLYGSANWLWGRLAPRYVPPAWWRVWLAGAAPLALGTLFITLTANEPRLPPGLALQVAIATLLGLGLALLPGKWAARRPRELAFLIADGGGLASLLLSVSFLGRAYDYAGRGVRWPLLLAAAGIAVGIFLLLFMTGFHVWRRRAPSAPALLAAGLCIAYLFLPALHHVAFTDGYYYISDAQNYFADRRLMQLGAWIVVGGFALGLSRLRCYLFRRVTRRTKQTGEML